MQVIDSSHLTQTLVVVFTDKADRYLKEKKLLTDFMMAIDIGISNLKGVDSYILPLPLADPEDTRKGISICFSKSTSSANFPSENTILNIIAKAKVTVGIHMI